MPAQGPTRDAVVRQTERILSSSSFAAAERSRALLRFVVEQTLDGHSARLKEYTLGSVALGRGEAFDPRTDPIVRAEASRLRGRLGRYYATEGATDDVLIVLPKGSYAPRFENRAATEAISAVESRGIRPTSTAVHRLVWLTVGGVAVGAVAAIFIRSPVREALPQERIVPLTALPGTVWWPTFSPDGRQAAFVWTGDRPGNRGIYVKMVGSSEVRRLVDGPPQPAPDASSASAPARGSLDFVPQWSPDGLQIAFVRSEGPMATGGTIHLVSALGGAARRLSDWPVVQGPKGSLSWSPDARFLAAARAGSPDETRPEAWGIYLVPLEGGEPRLLARAGTAGRNLAPAFSPDGRHLAFFACETREASPCDVHVIGLDRELVPAGASRRVTQQRLYSVSRLAWTADGRWLLYDSEAGPETFYLWRVAADGSSAPERIESAGVGAWLPAVSGDRLAYTRWRVDSDIVRFAAPRSRQVLPASSSYWDGSAHFSPDGQRVAFESMRSGERQEIWLADADGSDPIQLTRGPGRLQGSPAWSPDGRRIVFDSQDIDGHWNIHIMDVAGGSPRKLTVHPGDENLPRWSRNGRWIYFHGRREGRAGIWRIPPEGGVEDPVVAIPAGVGAVEESTDGQTLYYTTDPGSPLFAHPLNGGADRKLVDCVNGLKGFAVVEGAIYYVECGQTWGSAEASLHRLDVQSGEDRVLGTLEAYRGSLMVSPDERTVLYTSVTRTGSDLMLVENFGGRLATH